MNLQPCQAAARVFALLDALIQLDARPDTALLARFLPNWSVQSLVLMGRAVTNRDQALLPFLDSASGFTWNAVANLLIDTKPPGFASRLLQPLRLRLEVRVVDQADGSPVFYRRSVHQPGLVPCPSNQIGQGPTAQERLDYTAALGRPLERPRMYATKVEIVAWTDAEDLRGRASAARRNFEAEHQTLLSALIRQGRLSESERAALPPTISVSFVDERANKSVPLPLVE